MSKLPADRFASAAQFAEALTNPGSIALAPAKPGTRRMASQPPAGRGRAARAGGGLVLAGVVGAALWTWLSPAGAVRPRQIVRFGIELPRDAQPVGATGSTIAYAPDGSRIVYIGRAPSGQRLYSRGLDQLDPVPIAGSDGGILPFFSPDGQWLGFRQGTRIVKVALAGGPVTPVCDAPGETYGATWTASDTILFASDSGLMAVAAAGGRPRVVAKPDSGEAFRWPEVLPGDRAVLFTSARQGAVRLAVMTLKTGAVKRLQQPGGYPRYVTAGYVVLSDPSGIVSAVPFDARRLAVTGAAVPFADKLQTGIDGDRNLGVSASGDIAYQLATTGGRRLVLVDRSGAAHDVQSDTGLYFAPRLSPDGRRVAVGRWSDINFSSRDVWVLDLVQHTRTRLTFDTTAAWPAWSPDARRVAYQRGSAIYWVPADGSGAPDSLVTLPGQWFPAGFSRRDAVSCSMASPRRSRKARSGAWPRAAHRGQKVLGSAFHNLIRRSPDGRWMAYMSDESGRFKSIVRPYPGPAADGRCRSTAARSRWSPAGREIFYRNGDRMMTAPCAPWAPRSRADPAVRGHLPRFPPGHEL